MKLTPPLTLTLLPLMFLLSIGVSYSPVAEAALPAVLQEMPANSMAVISCKTLDSINQKLDFFAHHQRICNDRPVFMSLSS